MPDGEIEGNFSHGFSVILNSTQSVERGQNRVTNVQTGLPKKVSWRRLQRKGANPSNKFISVYGIRSLPI